jgi:hypothetical protein
MKNERLRRIDSIAPGTIVSAAPSSGVATTHDPVTLGAGSDSLLTLIGQQLTLSANVTSATELATAVSDHAALTTGVHGAGASTLATVANIATAVSDHAGLGTGVHGVGASTVASVANIATHAGLITGVHGLAFTAGKTLTLTESLTLNALPFGRLAVATAANTLGPLAVGMPGQYLSGAGAGVVPAWAALNQAAVAGLTTADGPTFDHLHITNSVAVGTTLTVTGSVSSDLLPTTSDAYDLGSTSKLWRKGYLSEMEAFLFAENSISVIGGWLYVAHDEGVLPAELAAAADTCDFGKTMTVGDFVVIRSLGQVEYFQVGANTAGTTYKIGLDASGARDLDGSGANLWPAGSVFVVLGTTGDGRIQLVSNGTDSPYITIGTQGVAYNTYAEKLRLGNLRGTFGTGANDRYGIGIGDYAGGNYLSYNAEMADGFVISAGGGKTWIDGNGLILSSDGTGLVRWAASRTDYANWNGLIGWSAAAGLGLSSIAASVSLTTYDNAIFTGEITLKVDQPNGLVSMGRVGAGSPIWLVVDGGLHVGGTSDPGDNNLVVDGTAYISGVLTIPNTIDIWQSGTSIKYGADVNAVTRTDATAKWGKIAGPNYTAAEEDLLSMMYTSQNGYALLYLGGGNSSYNSFQGILFYTGANNTVTGTERMRLNSAGCLYIGDNANAKCSLGLTINQGEADNEVLAFKSSDVGHGFTDNAEADTFGSFDKAEATSGGLAVRGWKDADGVAGHALVLAGYLGEAADTTKSTSGIAPVVINARVLSGTTYGDCGANANLVAIRNNSTARFLFDAEGSAHSDVEWITFDAHNDVALLKRLEESMLDGTFGEFMEGHRRQLESLDIAHFDGKPGHAMVNWTRLSMLLVGAMRQQASRIDVLEQKLLAR